MSAKIAGAWSVSYFRSSTRTPRKQFKTWHIPAAIRSDLINDGELWRVRINGLGFEFEDTRRITSGKELLLRKAESELLSKAMKRYPTRTFKILLLMKIK